ATTGTRSTTCCTNHRTEREDAHPCRGVSWTIPRTARWKRRRERSSNRDARIQHPGGVEARERGLSPRGRPRGLRRRSKARTGNVASVHSPLPHYLFSLLYSLFSILYSLFTLYIAPPLKMMRFFSFPGRGGSATGTAER